MKVKKGFIIISVVLFVGFVIAAVIYRQGNLDRGYYDSDGNWHMDPEQKARALAKLEEDNRKAKVSYYNSLLYLFEKKGIWKVDRRNHRCLVDPGVWVQIPFDKKEQCLQGIYTEEGTWWELYDMYSGKLLGKVSSWGWKVYP